MKLKERLRGAMRVLDRYDVTRPSLEPIYRDLFLRELSRAGVEDVFYPVGAAANHSLLYLIARILRETSVRSVLELGAGQSTILLDRMKKAIARDIAIATLEHDEFWAARMQADVAHSIYHAPLASRNGFTEPYYHHPLISEGPSVDFLIIDGPPVTTRTPLARFAAIDLVASRLAADFVIIIDDADRSGERKLGSEAERVLKKGGIEFRRSMIRAAKSQIVIAAGKLMPVAFF
jgi:hypothetical protein